MMKNKPATIARHKNQIEEKSIKNWLKKIGVAGFLFFFIKGLVWTFVFVQAGRCALG